MLKIQDNKLILSPELIALLEATPGDKITIEYSISNSKMIPVILKSDHGNILTKSHTVSFKGKQKETLLQFGTEFNEHLNNGIIELIGNKNIAVYKAVYNTDIEEPIDKSIILDTNYNIQKFEIYEL